MPRGRLFGKAMGTRNIFQAVTGALVTAGAVLFVAALVSPRAGPAALLAAKMSKTTLRSVGYYENLMAADSWEAGPVLAIDARRGRMQLLAQIQTHRLGNRGKALVKLCSEGNNQACAQIARSPREMGALQSQEVAQQRRAQQLLQQKLQPYGTDPEMMAGVRREAKSMASQEAMAYHDQADSGNIWDASHWQSGAMNDVVSNQWLAACGKGNTAACNHIARSNGALQALLTSSERPGPPIEAYMPSQAPQPVFVSAKKQIEKPGMITNVMDFLGLSDSFDQSGVHSNAIPKMVPDVGFHKGSRYTAVWNDGTIAPELSDNANAKKFYHDAGKMLKMRLDFSDTVKSKPQALWKQ